jgi:hypothetical protein
MSLTPPIKDEAYENGETTVPWMERKAQVLKLCKDLWPTALNHECHDRIMGGYNEVIPVTITLSPQGDNLEFVIRLLLHEWLHATVMDSVATLHHIRQTTSIPVPKVVAYDTDANNAMKSPYMVLERLPGKALEDVLNTFSTEQRKTLAKEIGELYTQLRETKSACSGRIVASPAAHMSSLRPEETLSHVPIDFEPYGACAPPNDTMDKPLPIDGSFDGVPSTFVATGGLSSDPPNISIKEAVTRPFDRRYVQHMTWWPCNEEQHEVDKTLRGLIETIVGEGRVEGTDGEFCLWHSDLFPRNIIVDVDASPMITGIIDWDEAIYAPKFVAAVAPTWLWIPREEEDENKDEDGEDEEEEEDDDDDDDEIAVSDDEENETYARAWEEPPSDELREVRREFCLAAGDECVDSCTDHYAIIARRIMRFALEWQWPWWWHTMYQETLGEWRALREESDDQSESEDEEKDENESGHEDGSDDGWETESESESKSDDGSEGGTSLESEGELEPDSDHGSEINTDDDWETIADNSQDESDGGARLEPAGELETDSDDGWETDTDDDDHGS